MNSENYFESKYVIDFYDLTQYEEASPMTMLRLLQETAGDHHFPIGENIIDLYRKNLGWVLLSGAMQFDRYPKYKEEVTIRTWLSKYKSIRGIRENLIYDGDNKIIGRAKGLWLFFDVEKRRPVPIPDKFKQIWGSNTQESIDFNINTDIPVLTDGEIMDVIKVKKFDIDANKHVNNLRYFQWLIEVVPDKVMKENYLHTIHGKFLHEANYGDQLLIYTKIVEMNKEFLHTVFDLSTNKVCVTARTFWKKR
jgi:acyl-ACP thioesterase